MSAPHLSYGCLGGQGSGQGRAGLGQARPAGQKGPLCPFSPFSFLLPFPFAAVGISSLSPSRDACGPDAVAQPRKESHLHSSINYIKTAHSQNICCLSLSGERKTLDYITDVPGHNRKRWRGLILGRNFQSPGSRAHKLPRVLAWFAHSSCSSTRILKTHGLETNLEPGQRWGVKGARLEKAKESSRRPH